MLKRTITGVSLSALVLVCIWLQGYFVFVPLTIAALICMNEMLSTLKKAGKRPIEWVSYLYMLATAVAQAIVYEQDGGMAQSMAVNQLCIGMGVVVGFASVVARGKVDMDRAFSTIIPIIYPGMFWAMIYPFNLIEGKMLTLIALALCFFLPNMNDLFALLVGMNFGRHKLSPNISPKKTIEGSIGGLVASVVFALFIPWLFSSVMSLIPYTQPMVQAMPAYWQFAVLGLPCGIAAQFGDLSASLIKRQCGVKDFGSIFPGHGGMLDRMDSVFFCTPVVLAFFMIMGV